MFYITAVGGSPQYPEGNKDEVFVCCPGTASWDILSCVVSNVSMWLCSVNIVFLQNFIAPKNHATLKSSLGPQLSSINYLVESDSVSKLQDGWYIYVAIKLVLSWCITWAGMSRIASECPGICPRSLWQSWTLEAVCSGSQGLRVFWVWQCN